MELPDAEAECPADSIAACCERQDRLLDRRRGEFVVSHDVAANAFGPREAELERLRLAERLSPRRPSVTQDTSQRSDQVTEKVVLHIRRPADELPGAHQIDVREEPAVPGWLKPHTNALSDRLSAIGPQRRQRQRRHCHPPPVLPQSLSWVRIRRWHGLWRQWFLPFRHAPRASGGRTNK